MQLGTFKCSDCDCCNSEQAFDDAKCNADQMRCTRCGCFQERPRYGMTIRLYLHGPLTLELLGAAREVALSLGASHELALERERADRHYVEIPSDAIAARLEIERIRGDLPAKPRTARAARS